MDTTKLRLVAELAANAAYGVLRAASVDGFDFDSNVEITFGNDEDDGVITATDEGDLTISNLDENGVGTVTAFTTDEDDDGNDVEISTITTTIIDADGTELVSKTDGEGNPIDEATETTEA